MRNSYHGIVFGTVGGLDSRIMYWSVTEPKHFPCHPFPKQRRSLRAVVSTAWSDPTTGRKLGLNTAGGSFVPLS